MTKKATLLVNLGTPKDLTRKSVKAYLQEFLLDPLVIDTPWLFRQILVRGIIAPFRSKKSLHAYEKVWTEKGSPLLSYSEDLASSLNQSLPEDVFLAMRYGEPSIKEALNKLKGYSHLNLVPLYPQYALSTTETVKLEVKKWAAETMQIQYLDSFFDLPDYTECLAESIRPYLDNVDHLLFSYHGLPNRHITKLDPSGKCLASDSCCAQPGERLKHCYRAQCVQTTEQVANVLGLKNYSTTFQSRFGKDWLQPYTDVELKNIAKSGVKRLGVVCPAFIADCLETLEEMGIQGKETFLQAGGESFTLIPCLNAQDIWVKSLADIIKNQKGHWQNL